MSERKLHCAKCGLFMATIRDASIRKGITVLCYHCGSTALNPKRQSEKPTGTTDIDWLKKMFTKDLD